jgi:TRAP transporter 4TM/12TM fusion protein
VYTLFYGTSGVMSTPVQVCLKFIAVFIIFGAFLERTGISNFFIDLANSLVGSAAGGPAKVAVISSALCGMVSGSSVGNTVTTGSVTIPMMKKTGYKPEFAGAVEAASSTGGQIMPPIMGAAAFLMAEYMGVTYGQVTLWAILPAILYFTGIFIAVHLEAKKLGLEGIPRSQLPNFWKLQRYVYLLLPLVVLIWLVTANIRSLQFSASIAIIFAVIVSLPGTIGKSREEGKRGGGAVLDVGKKTWTMIVNSLEAGGRGCITVAVACSMAGMIAGCITVTGLASKLIGGVIAISKSIPNPTLATFIALFLTMLCCIVLGMGVPTTANYCIMASTCAPILITLGIPKVAAHFFVFYFGIVADITPPVALAAYAGSAIAKADPMKTGVNATKLAIAAFVVPYIFAMNPSMLLMNEGFLAAVEVIITSLFGIFAMAAALNGHVYRNMSWFERLIFAAGGITLLIPTFSTDVIGLVLVAGMMVLEKALSKRGRAEPPAPQPET